jgi:hypothetical protein
MWKFLSKIFKKNKVINPVLDLKEKLKEPGAKIIHVYRQFKDELSGDQKTHPIGWYLVNDFSYYSSGVVMSYSHTGISGFFIRALIKNKTLKLISKTETQKEYNL